MKIWAVCCYMGYCFSACTDGGFIGDPKLHRWASDPLGRTCRMVLYVLFVHNEFLRQQILQSGVMLACDNFFTSPTLFLCLAAHGVYAVGTLKSTLRGAAAAMKWWAKNGKKTSSKHDMLFLRWGEVAFTLWKDAKDVFICTTIHVYHTYFKGVPYRYAAAITVLTSPLFNTRA